MSAAQERLEVGSLADVKARAERAVSAPSPELTPRDLPIELNNYWDADAGKSRSVVVTSRVMNRKEREAMTVAVADFTAGRAWHSLPPGYQARIVAMSRCAFQLSDAPTWLLDALQVDDDLLFRVEEVLVGHESDFRRGVDGSGRVAAESFRLSAVGLASARAPKGSEESGASRSE